MNPITPQIKNAIKVGIAALVMLALVVTIPIVGLVAGIVIVPYMIYVGYFGKDAPFPKPWNTPKF